MQGGVRVLTELLDTISLEEMDIHVMLDEISDVLATGVIANLKISLIAYLSMIREMGAAVFANGPT